MVRAKFKVDSIEQTPNGFTIKATPVIGGSEENKEFFRYTPSGSLTLATINEAAAKQFVAGQSFYLDFTPAE